MTADGGASWRAVYLSAQLGQGGLRLIAVDRASPTRVFLRVSLTDAEALGVFDAATDTLTLPLTFPGGLMTAFVQTAAGPLVAAGRLKDGVVARSLDGGLTWKAVAGAPHVRALAERAGTLYAAADDTADGYALGVSTDLGLTFRALMRFAQVGSIAPCVRASCQATCNTEVALGLWPASMCTAAPESPASGSTGCAVEGGEGLGAPAPLGGAAPVVTAVLLLLRRRSRGEA